MQHDFSSTDPRMNKRLIISGSLLSTVAAVAIYCSVAHRTNNPGVHIPGTSSTIHTETGAWRIDHHIEHGILSYAVILGPTARSTGGWVRRRTSVDGTPFVELWQAGDRLTSLLGSGRVFQVIDPDYGTNRGVRGQVAELSQRISGATFQAFLDSKPSDYSLASLTNYSTAHP